MNAVSEFKEPFYTVNEAFAALCHDKLYRVKISLTTKAACQIFVRMHTGLKLTAYWAQKSEHTFALFRRNVEHLD